MNRQWVARVAASAAIRKVVYIAIAAFVAFIATSFDAKAQSCPSTSLNTALQASGVGVTYPTSAAALAACQSGFSASSYYGQTGAPPSWHERFTVTCSVDVPNKYIVATAENHGVWQNCQTNYNSVGNDIIMPGWGWTTFVPEVGPCDDKPPILNKSVAGNGSMCSGGCEYAVALDGVGPNRRMNIGGPNERYFASKWEATGVQCSTGTPTTDFDPDKEICLAMAGGFGECIKPDGRHCIIASTGKQLCWQSSPTPETGPKITTDGSLAGDRQVPPNTPAPHPSQEGHTPGPTTTTGINGIVVVVGTGTGTGNRSGQGNTGVPGDRNGNGSRNGTGDEGEGEDDGGEPAEGVGELYEGEGETIGEVFAEFQSRIGDAPLIDAAGNFFSAPSGGACPTWSIAASQYWDAMTFDYHCSGAFAAMLALCGYVLLAVAAFAAFRIAVY